jgi:cell cycle protein kinase DBF2
MHNYNDNRMATAKTDASFPTYSDVTMATARDFTLTNDITMETAKGNAIAVRRGFQAWER